MNILPSPIVRKILVVDDDPRLRDLLRRYLTDQGFNVLTAEDGQEMTKIWHREHIDLFVLDLMLPPLLCLPRAQKKLIALSVLKWAQTITFQNPLIRANF